MSTMAEKINKLLAQAEGTHSEPERDSAMKMAYKLMAKYAIDEMDLESAGDTEKSKINILEYRVSNPYATARLQLLVAIADNMNVQMWYVRYGSDVGTAEMGEHWKATRLCGFDTDIERVTALFESLNSQMDSSMKSEYEAWKSINLFADVGEIKIFKSTFLRSFGNRISGRLRDMYRKEIENAGYGLVLVDRDKRVSNFMIDEGIHLRSGGCSTNKSSYAGMLAGQRQGNAATLNKGIGGG